MAKQSAYLKRLQEQKEREQRRSNVHALQMGMDVAVLPLNRAFGFGPERLNRFREMYQTVWDEYSDLISVNAKDDPSCEYAYAKMDKALMEICGEYYTPRELRYD